MGAMAAASVTTIRRVIDRKEVRLSPLARFDRFRMTGSDSPPGTRTPPAPGRAHGLLRPGQRVTCNVGEPRMSQEEMRHTLPILLCAGLAIALWGTATAGPPTTPKPGPSFERDIAPLFNARCAGCHSGGNTAAGFSAVTRGDMVEGGHSGPGLIPGSPEQSLLYRLLADGRMPKGGRRFTPAELQAVAGWIRSGAPTRTTQSGHWAFVPPRQRSVPTVQRKDRVRTPVDAFVQASLEARGLSLGPDAPRRVLIRRVTLDLVGVPPTPEEVDAFLSDGRPDAYERVVERLLTDPRHGERWARYWLDVAGYADSEGVLQEDRPRPNAWRYRDYVIRSLNADKPYDQFLREQIAGDELAGYPNITAYTPTVEEQLTATGFLRTAVDATRDDFNPHQYGEYQYRMLHDTQTIVFSTALGLTIQCARCHDHKHEPISQKDYYRVQSLFMGAVRPRGAILPTNRRQIPLATPAEQDAAKKVNAEVDAALAVLAREELAAATAALQRAIDATGVEIAAADRPMLLAALAAAPPDRTASQKALLARYPTVESLQRDTILGQDRQLAEARAELNRRRAAESGRRVTIPEIRAFYDLDGNPPPTPLLLRGEWLKPGETVTPGVPAVLATRAGTLALPPPAPAAGTTGRRLAFARWLTQPEHPLTARVFVNRLWLHHFGEGIVPTPDNFGRSGRPPTHPALLDWLAYRFSHGGPGVQPWSIRALHRLLVTSTVYRQASGHVPGAARVDPENRLLWRYRPRRLEAEAIRDSVLAVAGSLDQRMFGEPVGLDARGSGEVAGTGEAAGGRRSVYLTVRRTQPVTFLNVFDAPVMETNCPRRVVSTTASQALTLMNGSFLASQGAAFARRVLPPAACGGADAAAAVERAFALAFGRPPAGIERTEAAQFLRDQEARHAAGGRPPDQARLAAWSDFCRALLSSNEFVYVD